MLWFFLTVLSAFFVAVRNAIVRKLTFTEDRLPIVLASFLGSAGGGLITLFFVRIPELKPDFYWAVALTAFFLTLARFFLTLAISEEELGEVFPLIALSPIFTVGASYLILGERVTLAAFLGIIAIVVGSYLLHAGSAKHGLFEPFRQIFRKKGSRNILVAAVAFALSGPFAKIALNNSSPYFAFAVAQTLCLVGTAVILLFMGKIGSFFREYRSHPFFMAGAGAANFLQALLTYIAFGLTLVSYVGGVKGVNILFTVILAHVLFQEKKFLRSVAIGMIMLAGIVLIALG